jgi:hypothetical protein
MAFCTLIILADKFPSELELRSVSTIKQGGNYDMKDSSSEKQNLK